MAIHLATAGDYLQRTTSLPSPASDRTVMFWARFPDAPFGAPAYGSLYALLDDPAIYTDWELIWVAQPDPFSLFSTALSLGASLGSDFGHLAATSPFTSPVWHHLALTQTATVRRLYVDGVLYGTQAYYTGGVGDGPATSVTFDLSAFTPGYEVFGSDTYRDIPSLDLGYFRQWAAALTVPEILAEIPAPRAVRTLNLFMDTPLESAADLTDYSGHGRDWTAIGTPTTLSATRFYLTTRSPGTLDYLAIPGADTQPYDATQAGDRLNNRREWTWRLSDSKVQGGRVLRWAVPGVNQPTGYMVLFARWITDPLAAQTISGDLDLALGVGTAFNAPPGAWTICAYITVGSTDAIRGVLCAVTEATGHWASPGTFQIRDLTAPITFTPVDAEAGDYLVLEIGVRFGYNALAPGPTTASLTIATTNGPLGAPFADAVVGAADTLVAAGYVDFTSPILFGVPSVAPANTTCDDAIALPTAPCSVGPIDTTASPALDRAVWYTFTPVTSGIYGLHTFGSNYHVGVDVIEVGCATPSFLSLYDRQSGVQWIQAATLHVQMDLVAATQYWIRLRSVTNNFSATHSGGRLFLHVYPVLTPQTDDVIINAQHIVVYRAGQIINANSSFFGDTPTGASIDFTHRPLVSLNDDSIQTATRFVLVFFGFDLIEYLNLATLSNREFEVTYIDMGDGGVPANSHSASLVWDRAGNIYVGFFGDNYSVIGGIGTPNTIWVRKFAGDITVSNFPGAEFQLLATYQVEQDLGGSDYLDLSSDQRTLFYTSSGTRILRFDTITNLQLADFGSVPLEVGVPRPGLRGLRLLPPGNGSAGLLVTNGINIKRLDASGAIIQTYTPTNPDLADIDKLELTFDGLTFWATDQLQTYLLQFDLATGTQLQEFALHLPTGQLSGFTIYGGYRAGLDEPPEPPIVDEPPTTIGCPQTFPIDPGGGGCSGPMALLP